MSDGDNGLSTEGFISVEVGGQPEQAPAAEPQNLEPEQDVEEPEEQEESEQEEAEQPRKPRKPASERIAEITAARRDAERQADYWRKVANGEIERPKQEVEAAPVADTDAPNPDDFEFGDADPKYVTALVQHSVKIALDNDRSQRAESEATQETVRAWEAAQSAARTKYADYDQVVTEGAAANAWPCTREMAQALHTSELGGEVAYHLASNPDEARRIASLNPISQIRELGKLEARLGVAEASPKPKPTNAPTPPSNGARGAGGRFEVAPDTDDFAAFEKKYGGQFAS
jgi:hypothetical protein